MNQPIYIFLTLLFGFILGWITREFVYKGIDKIKSRYELKIKLYR